MRLLLVILLCLHGFFHLRAQSPQIVSILVNSCNGNTEGTDEYFVFQSLDDTVFVDSMTIYYPNETFCNVGCGSQTNGENASYISQLNALAGCVPSLFIYSDTIPPGATVIVFTGNPPASVTDFSSQCGNGQYYAVFSNNTSTSGRFANSDNDPRTLMVDFGSETDTVSYIGDDFSSNQDGNVVDFDYNGNSTYGNVGNDCIYPLGVNWGIFNVFSEKNTAFLEWETKSETNNGFFIIERRSPNEYNFYDVARITAKNGGNTNFNQFYDYQDFNLYAGIHYYRIRQVDVNGESNHSVMRSVLIKEGKQIELIKQNDGKLFFNQSLKSNKLAIYDLSGRLLHQVSIDHETNILEWKSTTSSVFFIQILDENNNLQLVKFVN